MSLTRILYICFMLVMINHLVESTLFSSLIIKNRQEKTLNRFLDEIRELDLNLKNSGPSVNKEEPQVEPERTWTTRPVELKVSCELGTHIKGSRISLCCKNPSFFTDNSNKNSVNCRSLDGVASLPLKEISIETANPASKDLSRAMSNFIKLVEELDARGSQYGPNKT